MSVWVLVFTASTMMKEYYKHPRIYLKALLVESAAVDLDEAQTHYLKNVLRKTAGDMVRVFNGVDGEWAARIERLEKKSGTITLTQNLRVQPAENGRIHLFFAPIRKTRLDILMEKAVELGVSDFHPVITRRTENRNLNLQRLEAQIFEAAEQCERLVIPNLHTPVMLDQVLRQALDAPLYVALEREEKKTLAGLEIKGTCGFLIGPEGGFDDEEIDLIRKSGAVSVSLGEAVLRAETASVVCLTHVMLCRQRG